MARTRTKSRDEAARFVGVRARMISPGGRSGRISKRDEKKEGPSPGQVGGGGEKGVGGDDRGGIQGKDQRGFTWLRPSIRSGLTGREKRVPIYSWDYFAFTQDVSFRIFPLGYSRFARV